MFTVFRLTALLALGSILASASPAVKKPTCHAVCPGTDGNGNALTENVPESDINLLFCQWAGDENYGYYYLKGASAGQTYESDPIASPPPSTQPTTVPVSCT